LLTIFLSSSNDFSAWYSWINPIKPLIITIAKITTASTYSSKIIETRAATNRRPIKISKN